MVIRQKVIQDIVTENALLADFEGDKRFLIYPHNGVFTPTGLTTDTDEILDKMSENRYSVSREVEKDINLLLRAQ